MAVDVLFELDLNHAFLAVDLLIDLIFGFVVRVFPDTNEQCLLPSADDVCRLEFDIVFFFGVDVLFFDRIFEIEKLLDGYELLRIVSIILVVVILITLKCVHVTVDGVLIHSTFGMLEDDFRELGQLHLVLSSLILNLLGAFTFSEIVDEMIPIFDVFLELFELVLRYLVDYIFLALQELLVQRAQLVIQGCHGESGFRLDSIPTFNDGCGNEPLAEEVSFECQGIVLDDIRY